MAFLGNPQPPLLPIWFMDVSSKQCSVRFGTLYASTFVRSVLKHPVDFIDGTKNPYLALIFDLTLGFLPSAGFVGGHLKGLLHLPPLSILLLNISFCLSLLDTKLMLSLKLTLFLVLPLSFSLNLFLLDNRILDLTLGLVLVFRQRKF